MIKCKYCHYYREAHCIILNTTECPKECSYFEKKDITSTFKNIPSCATCKHANYYQASFWYPYFPPQCSITHEVCSPTKICKEYEKY